MTLTDVQQDAWRRTAAHIELEPAAFSMSTWGSRSEKTICGTVACAAGSAVLCQEDVEEALRWRDAFVNGDVFLGTLNGSITCSTRAAELLGLSAYQAEVIFENSSPWWYETLKALDLLNEAQEELGAVSLASSTDGDEDYHCLGISAKQAAEVMRAVANGEIELPPESLRKCECLACRAQRDVEAPAS